MQLGTVFCNLGQMGLGLDWCNFMQICAVWCRWGQYVSVLFNLVHIGAESFSLL